MEAQQTKLDRRRHATGKVSVKGHRIVVDVSDDFVKYYNHFITKQYWIKLHLPMHGAHITIANDKLYSGVDWKKAKEYHGMVIDFEYDVDMIRGGRTKGFIMFYMKVFSTEIEQIKKDLGVIDNDRFKGLHLTISNSKAGVRPYWPEMITLK